MKKSIVLTEYTIKADLPEKIRIALTPDLHEQDPDSVLEILRKKNPDLILVPGDLIERPEFHRETRWTPEESLPAKVFHAFLAGMNGVLELLTGEKEHKPENSYRFLREAAQISPVFLSPGNHDWFYVPEDLEEIGKSGAILLDNADREICVRGVSLGVGGLSSVPDEEWLDDFSRKEGYKILLCHHPEYYERYVKDKDIDLILAGHAHGGQIRIGRRGIYAPGQGLFPKYTKGVYDGRMVVSAGCANTASVPRIGNPCEVVIIGLG